MLGRFCRFEDVKDGNILQVSSHITGIRHVVLPRCGSCRLAAESVIFYIELREFMNFERNVRHHELKSLRA